MAKLNCTISICICNTPSLEFQVYGHIIVECQLGCIFSRTCATAIVHTFVYFKLFLAVFGFVASETFTCLTDINQSELVYTSCPCSIQEVEGDSDSDSSDDPEVRRSVITGKRIMMNLDRTNEDHARERGRKQLLQFMNSQF